MKLLITGAWKPSEDDLMFLRSIGYELFFQQDEKGDLPLDYFKVDGIVCNGLFLYNDARRFKDLKFVQLTSAGTDRIPIGLFKQNGIRIFTANEAYSIPIAEYVVSSVLDLYKKRRVFFDNQEKHVWQKQRDLIELNGKNVCIVGCGTIGKECARLFKAFNCFVTGVDLATVSDSSFSVVYPINMLEDAVANSDIVIFALPLTNKTKGLANLALFRKMKKTSILVNVSRGGIVITKDLVEALNGKEISGAVLDVFENEPLEQDSVLWDMKNVIVSPHNSFVGDGNTNRLSKLIRRNLKN